MEDIAASPAATAAELQRLQAIIDNMPPLAEKTSKAAKEAGEGTRGAMKVVRGERRKTLVEEGVQTREDAKVEGDVTRKNAEVLGRETRQTARVLGREDRETGDVVDRQERLNLRHKNRNRRKASPGEKRSLRLDRKDARISGRHDRQMTRINARTNRGVNRFDKTTGKKLSRKEKRALVESQIAQARNLPPTSPRPAVRNFNTDPNAFTARQATQPRKTMSSPGTSVETINTPEVAKEVIQWLKTANMADLEYASTVILSKKNDYELRASRDDVIEQMANALSSGMLSPDRLKELHVRLKNNQERVAKHAEKLKQLSDTIQSLKPQLSWDEIVAIALIRDPRAKKNGALEEGYRAKFEDWFDHDLIRDPQWYTFKQAEALEKHVSQLLEEKLSGTSKSTDKPAPPKRTVASSPETSDDTDAALAAALAASEDTPT